MDPWGETLAYISWAIRASYHHTIMATPVQDVFGRDMLFKLASVVDQRVATSAKKRQVDIDNVRENAKRVTHDYAIGDQVYVEMTGIYRKLDYKKKGPYIITGVFKNGTVRFQRGQLNEHINIIRLKPHFQEQAYKTGSRPRCPLQYHYLVCIENRLIIVGIGQIISKELKYIYQSDRSDRQYVYSQVPEYAIPQIIYIQT